jgi:hypothetical protein
MKIKIITGFRNDQYFLIDASEAHKAYYLFNNPEERGSFNNGVALVGRNIQGIEPAWNEVMGWNPTHNLTDEDWNEIRQSGYDKKLRDTLVQAKEVSILAQKNVELLKLPLEEAKQKLLQ